MVWENSNGAQVEIKQVPQLWAGPRLLSLQHQVSQQLFYTEAHLECVLHLRTITAQQGIVLDVLERFVHQVRSDLVDAILSYGLHRNFSANPK